MIQMQVAIDFTLIFVQFCLDPYQPVKFAVVTKCNWAAEFGLSEYEDIIMLRISNTSLVSIIFYIFKKTTCNTPTSFCSV